MQTFIFFIFYIVHLIPGNSTDIYTIATCISVELNCDTAGYVPPNFHLHWYHNNNLIEDTYKYSTIYRPGRYRTQKLGGNTTTESVLSTLIIRSPTLNDTGKYECRVRDYNLTATVQLSLPTIYSTVSTNTALPYIIAISIVSIMLVLVSLVLILICIIVLILICIMVYCTHVSKRKASSGHNIVTSANVVYGVHDNEAYVVPPSCVIYDKID